MQKRTYINGSSCFLNWTKGLLILSVITAPLRAYRIGEVAGFNLSLFRLTWLIMVSIFSLRLVQQQRLTFIPRKVMVCFALIWLALISLVGSLTWSPYINEGDTITRVQVKIFGFVFVVMCGVVFLSNLTYIRIAIHSFVFSAVIPVLIGFYQYAVYQIMGFVPSLPLMRYSVIEDISAPGLGVLYGPLYRITGSFLEPNYFGIYLASVILMGLSLLVWREFDCRKPILRIALYFALGMYLIALILTFSISAILGFCSGLIVLILLALRSKNTFKHLMINLAILIPVFILIQQILFFRERGTGIVDMFLLRITLRLETAPTLFGREPYFARAFEAFAANPIMGAGAGALAEVTGGLISSGHNAFLTFLGEQGLIGFVPVFMLFVYILAELYRKYKIASLHGDATMVGLSAGLLTALVSTIIANQFYDAVFYYDGGWILVAIAAAYICGLGTK